VGEWAGKTVGEAVAVLCREADEVGLESIEIEDTTGDMITGRSLLSSILGGPSLIRHFMVARYRGPLGSALVPVCDYALSVTQTPENNRDRREIEQEFDRIVEMLTSHGWETAARGRAWFSLRLERELKQQRRQEPTPGNSPSRSTFRSEPGSRQRRATRAVPPFDDADWSLLMMAPLWAFKAVVLAGGEPNEAEVRALNESLARSPLAVLDVGTALLQDIAESSEQLMADLVTSALSHEEALRRVGIISDRLGADAAIIKGSIVNVAMAVAAAGTFLDQPEKYEGADPVEGLTMLTKAMKKQQAAFHVAELLRVTPEETRAAIARLGATAEG
jgi:hypothetical protein